MNLPDIEIVSAKVHEAWMASKVAQGVTSRHAEDGEELIAPYEHLSEKAKELDRGTVRAVYAAITAAQHPNDVPPRIASSVPESHVVQELRDKLAGQTALYAAASWHLEKLHNLFDNYGIPWMPFEATRARIQRMYRAWNVPGADVALSGEPEDQASSVPERATETFGQVVVRGGKVEVEPVPAERATEQETRNWSIEMRCGSYRVVNGHTIRDYHLSIYEGSHTEAEAREMYQRADAAMHEPAALPVPARSPERKANADVDESIKGVRGCETSGAQGPEAGGGKLHSVRTEAERQQQAIVRPASIAGAQESAGSVSSGKARSQAVAAGGCPQTYTTCDRDCTPFDCQLWNACRPGYHGTQPVSEASGSAQSAAQGSSSHPATASQEPGSIRERVILAINKVPLTKFPADDEKRKGLAAAREALIAVREQQKHALGSSNIFVESAIRQLSEGDTHEK